MAPPASLSTTIRSCGSASPAPSRSPPASCRNVTSPMSTVVSWPPPSAIPVAVDVVPSIPARPRLANMVACGSAGGAAGEVDVADPVRGAQHQLAAGVLPDLGAHRRAGGGGGCRPGPGPRRAARRLRPAARHRARRPSRGRRNPPGPPGFPAAVRCGGRARTRPPERAGTGPRGHRPAPAAHSPDGRASAGRRGPRVRSAGPSPRRSGPSAAGRAPRHWGRTGRWRTARPAAAGRARGRRLRRPDRRRARPAPRCAAPAGAVGRGREVQGQGAPGGPVHAGVRTRRAARRPRPGPAGRGRPG